MKNSKKKEIKVIEPDFYFEGKTNFHVHIYDMNFPQDLMMQADVAMYDYLKKWLEFNSKQHEALETYFSDFIYYNIWTILPANGKDEIGELRYG